MNFIYQQLSIIVICAMLLNQVSIVRAVSVHTTSVSMRGSSPAISPSLVGSSFSAAQCAIGDDPWPTSLENSARFIPQNKA